MIRLLKYGKEAFKFIKFKIINLIFNFDIRIYNSLLIIKIDGMKTVDEISKEIGDKFKEKGLD